MNTRVLLIASVLGGLASTVLVNTPVLNLANCLLCAGFWLGPLLAVWIYRRQTGTVSLGQGVALGTAAGAWHGLLGLLLSFVGLAGGQALADTYARWLPAETGAEAALAGVEALVFNLIGVLFCIAMGVVGGLIGGMLFREANRPAQQPV